MNIYVGNLSQQVTEDDLQKTFESFGQVTSIKIIKLNSKPGEEFINI
jgi:RNA recognition motif-containing protein